MNFHFRSHACSSVVLLFLGVVLVLLSMATTRAVVVPRPHKPSSLQSSRTLSPKSNDRKDNPPPFPSLDPNAFSTLLTHLSPADVHRLASSSTELKSLVNRSFNGTLAYHRRIFPVQSALACGPIEWQCHEYWNAPGRMSAIQSFQLHFHILRRPPPQIWSVHLPLSIKTKVIAFTLFDITRALVAEAPKRPTSEEDAKAMRMVNKLMESFLQDYMANLYLNLDRNTSILELHLSVLGRGLKQLQRMFMYHLDWHSEPGFITNRFLNCLRRFNKKIERHRDNILTRILVLVYDSRGNSTGEDQGEASRDVAELQHELSLAVDFSDPYILDSVEDIIVGLASRGKYELLREFLKEGGIALPDARILIHRCLPFLEVRLKAKDGSDLSLELFQLLIETFGIHPGLLKSTVILSHNPNLVRYLLSFMPFPHAPSNSTVTHPTIIQERLNDFLLLDVSSQYMKWRRELIWALVYTRSANWGSAEEGERVKIVDVLRDQLVRYPRSATLEL